MLHHNDTPVIPDPRGIFTRLPPAHFRVVARKSQGFTEHEIATEQGIKRRTVSSYAERARDKLGFDTFQQVQWAFYAEYAPGMWCTPAMMGHVDPLPQSDPTNSE